MRNRSFVLAVAAALTTLVSLGCSSGTTTTADSSRGGSIPAGSSGTGAVADVGGAVEGEPCPVDPVKVVVSVDQWGDIVEQLGGRCTDVTTIITGSAGDPHDYEPTAADIAAFTDAQLVVVNGLDYDHWALDAVDALPTPPVVVDAGEVMGLEEGANPHLWYDPDAVDRVAEAVTTELGTLLPGAASYLEAQSAAWDSAMQPYRDEIAAVKALAEGKTYAATESVFEYLATAVGLQDRTPEGFRNAAANESEPAPGDVAELLSLLEDGGVDVLIVNTQTEGSLGEQIRDAASGAGVPVVEVTETVPPGASSFVDWQVAQLEQLREALSS